MNVNCLTCGNKMIWNSDYDVEEEDGPYVMFSVYTCSNCNGLMEFYVANENHEDFKNLG